MNRFYIHNNYIEVIAEDIRGEVIIISLLNQPEMVQIVSKKLEYSPIKLGEKLVIHGDIGVKQPYLTLNGMGLLTLLNARPDNLAFKPKSQSTCEFLHTCDEFIMQEEYSNGINACKKAIKILRA